MRFSFHEISLDDLPVFERFHAQNYIENADYTFGNAFIWRKSWKICLAQSDIACYPMSEYHGNHFFLPPLYRQDVPLERVIEQAIEISQQKGFPFKMRSIPLWLKEKMIACMGDRLVFSHNQDRDDYVYRRDDLQLLPGKKYHAKRNHLSRFHAMYDYEYVHMQDDSLAPACMALMNLWFERASNIADESSSSLHNEREALGEAFAHFKALSLHGGAILIGGKLQAFTIGQKLNPKMELIHFEKGNTDFAGIYTVINQEFVSHLPEEIELVNREEDMGISGLRKAKQSYHPVFMVEKFTATFA